MTLSLKHAACAVVAALALSAGSAAVAQNCNNDCGQVLSVRFVQEKGKGSGLGAVLGGVAGGVLGHQIGSGRGNDVATALGAIGGAALGANTGQGGGGQVYTQDVHRCTTVEGPMRPEYWDVTYVFRGREHRVQMSTPPGRTITVNRNGEPRM